MKLARILAKEREEMARLNLSEDLQSSEEHLQLQRAVEEAEQDIADGNWVEHSEVVEKLKLWSDGEQ
jgi:predicted transcriptional regulator